MIYNKLDFPKPADRPFIYTDFVMTIDGKIWVKKDGYWPIGSKTDYETFTYLRAHADAIIDGKGTAQAFGNKSIETFTSESFRQTRRNLGKQELVDYIILTKHSDDTIENLKNNKYNFAPTVFSKDLNALLLFLNEKRYETVFIDGGPTLLASFIEQNLLDEIFLTISPKIFGNEPKLVSTFVEGKLFDSLSIPHFKILSVKQKGNEVFLRYERSSH
jgi:5-amino-6-(5-phosphoribosylamino)uracil reductase